VLHRNSKLRFSPDEPFILWSFAPEPLLRWSSVASPAVEDPIHLINIRKIQYGVFP
jgi:hypothetical protein